MVRGAPLDVLHRVPLPLGLVHAEGAAVGPEVGVIEHVTLQLARPARPEVTAGVGAAVGLVVMQLLLGHSRRSLKFKMQEINEGMFVRMQIISI